MAQSFVNTTVDSQSFLWQKVHFESVKQLKMNTDIVLTRPDKGAVMIILNRADYISKIDAILGDSSKFLKLGDLSFDDTQKLENTQAFPWDIQKKIYIEGGLWIYSSSRLAETKDVWIAKNS